MISIHLFDDADKLSAYTDRFGQLLSNCVHDGAAVSFLSPLTGDDAATWFRTNVLADVQRKRSVIFFALDEDELVGTVQLIVGLPQNQPHRSEIAKMLVDPKYRRRGIGRALMQAALDKARAEKKSLVTLDTRTGDVAEGLYASLGFQKAGVIPNYALDPDGQRFHSTTYMYKLI